MDLGALSAGHFKSQVEPLEQLTEQLPEQVTWQVEFPVQETLPLGPTVAVQIEPDEQFRLHEFPQLPVQVL